MNKEVGKAPVIKTGMEGNRGYVVKSQGYPVEPGQTWHDLTMEQRHQWMANHENRWKIKFAANAGSEKGSMNWTRG